MSGKKAIHWFTSGIYLLISSISLLYSQVCFCQTQNIPTGATVVVEPQTSGTEVVIEPQSTTKTPVVVVQPGAPSTKPSTVIVQPESPSKQTPTVVVQPQSPTDAPAQKGSAVVVVPVVQENISDQQRKVEDFVRKAADYVKDKGKEVAFVEFNKKNGMFTNGTNYIFTMDYQGNLLADGYGQELIGTNQFDLQDLDGKYINRDLIAKAKAGGGWELYRWPNPITRSMECKKTFVLPMEGYFIAGGYFFLPNADGKCE